MSNKLSRLLVVVIFIFSASIGVAHAGTLTPSSLPAANGYTLSNIYNRLMTNATATPGSHAFGATTTPQSTFPTLVDIYNSIPTIDPLKVFIGNTYLGITGSLTIACATTTFDGVSNRVPDAYDGALGNGSNRWCMTNTATGAAAAEDIVSAKKAWVNGLEITGLYNTANLLASNVKAGTTFGTSSTGTLIQAVGNAGAGDVLAGKTFSTTTATNVTGTIPVKSGDATASSTATSTQKIILTPNTGYYNGTTATVSTTSVDFDPANIKIGANIFGVIGTYVPATATSSGGYIGAGWVASSTGSGSTPLNKANCDAAAPSGWYWFEDANGDGLTTGSDDGECVRATAGSATSWNGAILMNAAPPTNASSTASVGSVNTISTTTSAWTVDAFKYHIAKITMGAANGCWGIVKSNTATAVTVYGSWLQSNYAACAANPDSTSGFKIYDDNKYDNSWIGDYTCTGNFPSGTVVSGSYPSTENSALAQADCYDGKRDLLPNEIDRAVASGTATAANATSITDMSRNLGVNFWIGQKVLITSGTGNGSYGIIESNTGTSITVASWSGTTPVAGDTFKIIYIMPRASYISCTTCGTGTGSLYLGGANDDARMNKGPLTYESLKAWKGTRLPTSMDFVGFCGAKAGDSYNSVGDSAYKSSGASPDTALGNYGGNVGRGRNAAPNDEYLYLSNSGAYEWLSEQNLYYNARLAGFFACSSVSGSNVNNSYRFRAVFRP